MIEKLKDRYILLSIFFIMFGIVIMLRLVNLQIVNGADNYEKSQNRLLSDRTIPAPRGNISDRNGVIFATSRLGYTVQIVKTGLNTKQLNEMLLNLTRVLEKNGDSYTRGLARYINIDNGQIVYGTSLDNVEDKIGKIKKDIGITYKDFTAQTPEEVFEYFKKGNMFGISDEYSSEDAYKIMTLRFELLIRGFSALNPITLASDISQESVAEIEERHDSFPGVTTETMYLRKYSDAAIASHVVGYVNGDEVGQKGVELSAEELLKGRDGVKNIEIDTVGRTTKELSAKAPIPGNNVIMTIDAALQRTAVESLERNIGLIRSQADGIKNMGDAFSGAAVALDVNSGEVRAMASFPGFEPAIFLEGSENKDAQKLIQQWMTDDANRPMSNRAIQDIYAPGSTYKPITAIAGLEEGVIGRYETINDPGTANIGGMNFICLEFRDYGWSHGPIALSQALATSCNIFFHILGDRTGIDNIDKWAKAFGLGEKTGIDIDSVIEARGIRANRQFKKERADAINKNVADPALREYDVWTPADTAQTSIGQLYNAFTPIQLANYVSTIANGGKKFTPHVIKRIETNEGIIVKETEKTFQQVEMKPETIAAVKEGMIAVTNANDGTAVGLFDDIIVNGNKVNVAGKTGTAETGFTRNSSNALFVCYAPAENPEIAVAVIIERGVWGSNAARVAKDILAAYFNPPVESIGETIEEPAFEDGEQAPQNPGITGQEGEGLQEASDTVVPVQ